MVPPPLQSLVFATRTAIRALDDRAKLRWHLDIAAHPPTHAWALSLYRAGEEHPETVADYFPHAALRQDWPELAEQLKRHAGDERRHAALYTRALDQMGEPAHEVAPHDVFNHVIRAQTPVRWAIDDGDSRAARRIKAAHFLSHAHHLEKRVRRSLEYHEQACRLLGRTAALATVERVHADEDLHVRSTLAALQSLTSRGELKRILALHAQAEQTADRIFSARQIRSFLSRLGSRIPTQRRTIYAARAFAMEQLGV